ncbi:hypothetical protein CsatB_018994 [Cannabis sativa]
MILGIQFAQKLREIKMNPLVLASSRSRKREREEEMRLPCLGSFLSKENEVFPFFSYSFLSLNNLSDSSEEFLPEDPPSAVDFESETEKPEAEPVSAEPIAVPATVPKKDKGKRPIVSPSPVLPQKRNRPSGISLDNFKPHSHYFCYNDHARDMKFYENRNFIVEKNFNVIAYKLFGVYNMLKERQWMDTLIGFWYYSFDGCVDRIVKEFYANITDEFLDEDSFIFGKVFVRGHWYSSTVKDVAEALNLPMGIETTDVEFDRQKVFGYLTGDNDVGLSDTMHMSQLTYLLEIILPGS